MDFTWETQSPNQMGVTTRLKHSNGRYGDEMSSPCEVEFNHNKLFHRLDAPDGSPSYRREIQDETRLFQSDCQNRIPSHFANRPIHCESSIQFPDTATYPGFSSTHNEIPLICAGNTPGVTSLYPWKAQTRMPPYGEGIQSDSNKLSRRHQTSSTNGIPFCRTDNPRELYIDNFPLNPRDLQQGMSQYAVGIQSSFDRTQQFQQPCSTNEIPSHQTGNTSEMRPDNIPRINSSNPRKHNSRMKCGIDILSDSKKVIQLYQGRSTDGFPFYQTDNPRELYPGNIPRETPLDPREVQRRTPPNLVGVQSDSDNVSFVFFYYVILSCYFIVPYAYLYFTLSITFAYFRYYVNIGYIKTRTDVKFSIVPEEGWFGQPKYSTPSKKSSYVVSVFAFLFLSFNWEVLPPGFHLTA